VCASGAILRELDRALALDLSVIYPGVDSSREPGTDRIESRRALDLPEDALIVGSMGRWETGCGFKELIDSMYQVTAEHPTAHLALAGQGTEEAELRHRAEGLPEPECVHFLGYLEDTRPFFSSLDLFVGPKARAGTSIAAMEAMAEGVPVLLRNAGGFPEIILEDISGYLFEGDEQLGSRIGELLSMPMALETVGRAGRMRILERLTLEQSALSTVETYRSITQDLTT
jgi:glycosyltransferase involved in cell wall biosynthesis